MSFWTREETLKEYQFIKILKVALYYAKQHYKEINLITDYAGEKMLKNVFNWHSISTELESLPKEYKDVWSLGKIKSYNMISKYGDPFLHLDYDVFLIKPLPEKLVQSDLFCQSIEENCYSRYQLYAFDKYCKNKFYPFEFDLQSEDWAPNCGIIGGKDLDFFQKYSDLVFKLVLDEENKMFWLCHYLNSDKKSCIPEQYYLGLMSKFLNKKIETLFKVKFDKVRNLQRNHYVHLCREGKRDPQALKNIEYLNDFVIK